MPIYEYQCEQCGHEMDALQKMSDDALVSCPECHQDGLRRLVSAAGFRLTGSGWYETDFKHGQKGKDGKEGKNGKDGKDSKPKDSAKKDSKTSSSTKSTD